jgi:HSP90 family molecular chaperone
VSDLVEVYSKAGPSHQGVKWSSEGFGDYEISNISNLEFERGTKIVMRLKSSCTQFSKEFEAEKIIKKYSIFNKFPIRLNGSLVNK